MALERGGLDRDGRSVFEALPEFGVTGRRMADGKPTFQAESLAAPELVERQPLPVGRANGFLCGQLETTFRVDHASRNRD
jgi:hypothetical protein